MIYPQLIAVEGILNKNPLSIGTDGFLFIDSSPGIPTYRKRPGPYFYVDIDGLSTGVGIIGGSSSATAGRSTNTGVSSPSSPNRKRS